MIDAGEEAECVAVGCHLLQVCVCVLVVSANE